MQNKGLIKLFAILLGLISVYQLSFTYFTKKVEGKASKYAKLHGKDAKEVISLERAYLDSIANKPVVFNKFTYNDIKDKAINLGLDLKGGINAVLQVSVKDILVGLANNSKNTKFRQALDAATKAQKNTDDTYLNSFFKEFEKIGGDVKLSDPTIFGNKALRDKINFKLSNAEVKPILAEEVENSVNTALVVLRSRIDKFGVTQPSIQRIGKSGRILIELPGAKDIDRVKKLLQSTAELQFWEAYSNADVQNFFFAANDKLAAILKAETPTTETDTTKTKEDELGDLLGSENDSIKTATTKNLFSVLLPNVAQNQNQITSLVATARVADTAKVNKYLKMPAIKALIPNEIKYVKFLWDAQPRNGGEVVDLYAIKGNRQNKPEIEGDVIATASQEFSQFGKPEVSMSMNSRGTKDWARLTAANVGKHVAVVLDNYVHSAPTVNGAITGGRTSISGGSMTVTEAQDLANVLKAGKLPAPAHIIQDAVVGPSLGQKAIDSSMRSFVFALLLVFLWMLFYYGKAGGFADAALALNILFIFGILSAFGAVLTLPGIAGIILTIGMAVDANVIIFERIKEELNAGKSLKEAVAHGFSFKGALSAIIDANITTFLTGAILFIFGTGPVKGFAYTLMVGIVTSLFTGVFITRLLISWYLEKGKTLTFNTNITKGWFQNINYEFLRKRKIAYVISAMLILGGLVSLFTNGLNYGVDFVGGRSYIVKFENPVNSTEVATSLKAQFGDAPVVKTYGSIDQLKITTKYKIEEEGADDVVREALFNGVKEFLPSGTTIDDFKVSSDNQAIGLMSSIKVEPTIADDIKTAAKWAVFGSLLVVFLYILLRFRKWQFSLGAVLAVFHDVLLVLGIFSLLYKVLPFDMEIGESFIAAILTVVGYSLNDTVVIFDRIREYAGLHKSWSFEKVVDKGLSSTLGRTINTSLTTLVVLSAIFLFGGDSIRGFMFALIIGVVVGTYSSLFIAAPIMYDTTKKAVDKK